MDHNLVQHYIEEYTLEALEQSDGQIPAAADYLMEKKSPGFLSSHRKEKRAALKRVRKVFDSSRTRSTYIVLKSLGLDDLARKAL